MPSFGTPSHLDLSVTDAGARARWYCEVLGLQRARRADLVFGDPDNIQLEFRWTRHANV